MSNTPEICKHGVGDNDPCWTCIADGNEFLTIESFQQLKSERDALAKQLKYWQIEFDKADRKWKEVQAEIDALRPNHNETLKQIEKLESALKEYADTDNWDCEDTHGVRGLVVWQPRDSTGLPKVGPELAQSVLGVGKER